jgi:ABC-2 type transport system ATP-binding protein
MPTPTLVPGPTAPAPVPADAMVVVTAVSKWFGDLVAVSDVTFALRPGVTALLGPNGAGKSSLLRMLCGLTAPSNGTVRVLGRDPRTDLSLTQQMGIVPQQEGLFEAQTALQFVELAAVLYGVPNPRQAAREAIATVALDPDDQRTVPSYSKGMKQRVKIAQALVHRPDVFMMDEPLTGLDPRQRVHIIDLVHALGSSGACVVVSSHVLDVVERFGSRVLVIAQGRLAAEGDFRDIRRLMDDRPLRIRVRTDKPRDLASRLVAGSSVVSVHVGGADGEVLIETTDVARFRIEILRVARDSNAHLREVAPLDDDLESVFAYLVGR